MSTLRAPAPRSSESKPRLRPVATPAKRTRQLPFILVFVTLLAGGMVGLLFLTTTLQNQAFELRSLQREATELGYREAALKIEVDRARSPQALAALASSLGMRANLHPVYVSLPSGQIIGKPTPVKSSDASEIVVKTPQELLAEAATRAENERQRRAEQQRAEQSQRPQTQQTQSQQPQTQQPQTQQPQSQRTQTPPTRR